MSAIDSALSDAVAPSAPAAYPLSPKDGRRTTATASLPLDQVIAEIATHREEFERLSHVPREVIALLKRAGVYRAGTPQRFGGDALAPGAFLQIIERIAVADGSTAWVASFGSANVYLAALPLETQAQIYADGPDQVFAGGLFPVQPGQPVEGGWRVNGTWKFASSVWASAWAAPLEANRARPYSGRIRSTSSRTGMWSACRPRAVTTCA
jgi:alkylation response protein AidB-like acyl-CoA dehydrogenase